MICAYVKQTLILLSLVGWLWLSRSTVYAQWQPVLDNKPLDTSQFPNVTVSYLCTDAVASGSLHDRYEVLEDGVAMSGSSLATEQRKPTAATLVFVDLFAGDLSRPQLGYIGETFDMLWQEFFNNTPAILTASPGFAIYAPSSITNTPEAILPWTGQFAPLVNTLYAVAGKNEITGALQAKAPTPLVSLLWQAIKEFPAGNNVRKMVIVFSDGIDKTTADQLDALLAEANDVAIYTVLTVIDEKIQDAALLNRIAFGSGVAPFQPTVSATGDSAQYRAELLSYLRNAFLVAKPYTVCSLSYRSGKAQPVQVAVRDLLSDILTTDNLLFPPLNLAPPKVTIQSPMPGSVFSLPLTSTAKLAVSPLFSLTLAWDFPGQLPRGVRSVSYRVSTGEQKQQTIDEASVSSSLIPVALGEVDPGKYWVEVEVQDELGLIGRSSVPIVLQRPVLTVEAAPQAEPPLPAAKPPGTFLGRLRFFLEAMLTWLGIPAALLFVVTMLLLLLSFLLVVLVAILYWQRKAAPTPESYSLTPVTIDTRPVQPVNAILYRIKSPSEAGLRQVVLLRADMIELPQVLFDTTNLAPNDDIGERFTNLKLKIKRLADDTYQLSLEEPGREGIKIVRGGKPERFTQPTNETLHLGDVIELGATHYKLLSAEPDERE